MLQGGAGGREVRGAARGSCAEVSDVACRACYARRPSAGRGLSRPAPRPCRKVESFDAEKAGTVELESAEERDKRAADPFAKLEHGDEDKRRAMATFTQIAALQEESGAKHRWAAQGGHANECIIQPTCAYHACALGAQEYAARRRQRGVTLAAHGQQPGLRCRHLARLPWAST